MRAILSTILLLAAFATYKETVTFRLLHEPNDATWRGWVQPMLPMRVKLEYVEGERVAQPEVAHCKVWQDKETEHAFVKCGNTTYRIAAYAFEHDEEGE